MPPLEQRLLRINMNLMMPGGPQFHWKELTIYGGQPIGRVVVGMQMQDGEWLNVSGDLEPLRPWHSPTFLAAFLVMTAAAALLTVWTVRRLIAPVRTLAEAAEALGRDVNAPPLPENGPTEVATAAIAFNTMASRIRRFVQDRTELLTAIGHDLRTPITRLKLRAEFVEDDDQRAKILADLEELEAMVSATLAFGRDARTTEPVTSLDLAELLRTVIDEAGDAHPEVQEKLGYDGPAHMTVHARSLALKRVFVNLVSNAVAYGGSAMVRLGLGSERMVIVEIEDDGPGIEPADMDRVFEPFHRGEPSRSRETGGVGLGLPIARNIMLAHGGDVTLANRASGGLKATVTLPV
jgi:signal transduction histidine kinase